MSSSNINESPEGKLDNLQGVQGKANSHQYPCEGEQPIVTPAAAQAAQWSNIPAELRERPHWCVAAPDKSPRMADGRVASSTDPSTWTDFDTACRAAAAKGLYIGYMLHESDPFTCIDMDVKDVSSRSKDGKPYGPGQLTTFESLEFYRGVVDFTQSYTELSASRKGLHVWVEGDIGAGRRGKGLEIYSRERFMVCTGLAVAAIQYSLSDGNACINVTKEGPVPLTSGELILGILTQELGSVHPKFELVEVEEEITDAEIWKRANGAGNGKKFVELCNGDWQQLGYPSQSEADLVLMGKIAFYSPSNEQCRRMFRQTVLGKRDKATRNDTYLNRTLILVRATQQRKKHAIEHGREQANNLLWGYVNKILQSPLSSAIEHASTFRLVPEDEMASRPPVSWRIKNVIPKEGVVAFYGPSGSGKSFLIMSALGAVANGQSWFGRLTKPAPVVYVALEGKAGVSQRVKAYRSRFGDMNIHFIEDPMDLRLLEHRTSIVKTIRGAGLDNGVLCIDTLAASAPGMDENTSTDMGTMVAALQEIQEALGGVVLIVHHTGKDQSRGLRGWSGLTGALDNAIEVSRTDEVREWRVAKSKDGADGEGSPFDLDVVIVGLDEDGAAVTSCVVVSGDMTNKRDEHTTAVISMIREYYNRGEYISPAVNSPTTAYKMLKDDPQFPKGLNAKVLTQILREAERENVIVREGYQTATRNHKERWMVL